MNHTVVIYHANCLDGFGAAWAVRNGIGEKGVEFIPAAYGDTPPEAVTDKHVIIVDFSYPYDQICAIERTAKSVLVLDHHKTAEAALNMLPCVTDIAPWGNYGDFIKRAKGAYRWFDMNMSGAMIAWNFFNQSQDAPAGLKFIEDRDLWRFNYKQTKPYCAALYSRPMDFYDWDDIVGCKRMTEILIRDGHAIERAQTKIIKDIIKAAEHYTEIGGYKEIPTVNMP